MKKKLLIITGLITCLTAGIVIGTQLIIPEATAKISTDLVFTRPVLNIKEPIVVQEAAEKKVIKEEVVKEETIKEETIKEEIIEEPIEEVVEEIHTKAFSADYEFLAQFNPSEYIKVNDDLYQFTWYNEDKYSELFNYFMSLNYQDYGEFKNNSESFFYGTRVEVNLAVKEIFLEYFAEDGTMKFHELGVM